LTVIARDKVPGQSPTFLELKLFLNALRQKMNFSELVRNDPVQFVHRFKAPRDEEIAAFFSALLAFGRVKMIIKNLQGLFRRMEWRPASFIHEFDPKKEKAFAGFVHRFVKGGDIAVISYALHDIYLFHGGLKKFFLDGCTNGAPDLSVAIGKFVENFYALNALSELEKSRRKNSGIYFLMPPPGSKSAYKRLNLFLRWMVRKDGNVDTGLWKEIKPSQLIIPLDTHIARLSRNLGLTSRRTPDMKMAIEITGNLKKLAPEDPLKYDFPLCHLGISTGCTGKYNKKTCAECVIRDFCVI